MVRASTQTNEKQVQVREQDTHKTAEVLPEVHPSNAVKGEQVMCRMLVIWVEYLTTLPAAIGKKIVGVTKQMSDINS